MARRRGRSSIVSTRADWTCPTCAVRLTTAYCAACGEEPLAPRDLTLRWLAAKLIHASTSIDARALKAGVLAAAVGVIVVGYRFVVFLVTLYTT